jgi:hypothetical protein
MSSENAVFVVSGLPRSGTSMMMRMLEAGGIPVLKDDLRTADIDNPAGYYEFESVKRTREDPSWLDQAGGKAVKMVSRLLRDLPPTKEYRVIFMRRKMEEILVSQRRMLDRLGTESGHVSDEEIGALFEQHVTETLQWLGSQDNFRVLNVSYGDLLANPMPVLQTVERFLEVRLDTQKMAQVVDRSLYRERRS